MTKVKICGLSTKEAVETAVSAGADYIGFVFAPSKRQVTLGQAAELAKLIPVNVKKVGVFVSPSRAELLEAIDKRLFTTVGTSGVKYTSPGQKFHRKERGNQRYLPVKCVPLLSFPHFP